MILKLGMKYRGLKHYKIYIKSDPGLTLTYFTTRSKLVTCAFGWGKNCYKVIKREKMQQMTKLTEDLYF